jgi:aspartyl-tRNA(Asn)/glutamyl-tRNA(Gln) amidotransferase subunit C
MGVDQLSRISIDQVKHVANLARLAITEEEANNFKTQLDEIITYAEQLNEVNTDNIEPTTHVLKMKNVVREDEPKQGLLVEDVLKNAPDSKDGHIRVPSIID